MVYAHLIASGNDLHVTLRFGSRFSSQQDEEGLKPHIFETVFEESGHIGLLQRKLRAWSAEFGFPIQEIEALGDESAPEVSHEERIRMLEESVRSQALAREEREREVTSLQGELEREHTYAHHFYHQLEEAKAEAMYYDHLMHIARHEFRCDHIRRARAHHEQWRQENLH